MQEIPTKLFIIRNTVINQTMMVYCTGFALRIFNVVFKCRLFMALFTTGACAINCGNTVASSCSDVV